jgi:hypothetical protein
MSLLSTGVSWWYNWSPSPDQGLEVAITSQEMDFVPMWWGTGTDIDTVSAAIRGDARFIMGFNEPNFFAQADLSAVAAAEAWPRLESVADAKGLALVSPAVNFCGGDCHDEDPFHYLDDFFAACPECRVDALGIHIYVACDPYDPGLSNNRAQWLINHVNTYVSRFSQPLWITEFACSGNPTIEEQRAFMVDAVTFLENEPRVVRYAWFAGRVSVMSNVNLLSDNGILSELGETYIALPYNNEGCI